jgi:elongation factor P
MIPVTELRNGVTFKDSQGVWEVASYRHVKMGRGSATIRVKVKNLKTGSSLEKTFTSGQKVEEVDLEKKKGQFLYCDTQNVVFMYPKTFEQFSLPKIEASGKDKYLKEGEEYEILAGEDQVFGIEIPKLVVLEIAETDPGVRGDTVSNVFKDAILENGAKVKVPLFIKIGDKVKIDSRSDEYVERVK